MQLLPGGQQDELGKQKPGSYLWLHGSNGAPSDWYPLAALSPLKCCQDDAIRLTRVAIDSNRQDAEAWWLGQPSLHFPLLYLLYFDSRTCMDLYYPLTLVSFCFRFCTRPCLWRKLALQSFYPSIAESWKYRVHIPWQLCYLQVNDVGTKLQDLWRLTTIWHYCWEINVRLGRSQKLLKWLHWSCDISNMLMQAALSSIWFW